MTENATAEASEPKKHEMSDWVSPDLWDKYKDQFETGDLVEFRREGMLFQHWGLYLGEGLVVHVSSFDLWNPLSAFGERFTNASAASQAAVTIVGGASKGAQITAKADTAQEVVELVQLPKCDENGCKMEPNARVEKACGGTCVKCEDITIEPSPPELGFGLEERTKWFIKVEDIRRIAGRDQFRVNNVATRLFNRIARTPQEIFAIVENLKDQEVDYSLVSRNCEHFVTSLKYKQVGKTEEPPDVVPIVVSGSAGTSSQVRRVVQLISMGMVALVGLAGAAVGALLVGKTPAAAASKISDPSSKPTTKSKPTPETSSLSSDIQPTS